MADFDFDAYIASRLAENGLSSKHADVLKAAAEKKAELANPSTWVGKLGLEPGSFMGNRVNDAANFVSGAARQVGNLVAAPLSIIGQEATHQATGSDIEAYNRQVQGAATPEDMELLNRRILPTDPTMLEQFQRSKDYRADARAVNDTFDLSKTVDQTNRNALSASLAEGFQANYDQMTDGSATGAVAGLAGLLGNWGKAIIENPSGVREYVMENIPQLLLGAAGKVGQAAMTGANVGYAVDTFQKGMENYAKENGGAIPSNEEQQRMATQAAWLALAEQVGDVASLAFVKPGAAVAARGVAAVGKAGAKGVVTEGATEGVQTYLEGEIEGKSKTPLEIYEGMAIGAASGGAIAGGGRAVAEIVTPREPTVVDPNASAPVMGKADTDKARAAAVQAAATTGDVTPLADPKSPLYAPDRAIGALVSHSQSETVSDADKVANLAKSQDILDRLEAKERALTQQTSTLPERQATVAKLTAQLAAMPDQTSARAQMIQDDLDEAQALLASPALGEDDLKTAKATLADVQKMRERAVEHHSALGIAVNAKSRVEGLVELADAGNTEDSVKAASTLVNMAMSAPKTMTPEVAKRLIENTANGLTAPQREFLRTFDDARVAQNELRAIKDVKSEVLKGSKDHLGLESYAEKIGKAVAAGDQKTADKYMKWLGNFEADHRGKAEALNKGKPGQFAVRTKAGTWELTNQQFTEEERKRNGAARIDSPRFIEAVNKEAKAITATQTAMAAAYASKFNKGAPSGANVSTQTPNQGAQRQAAAAPNPGGTGTAAPAPGAPVVSGPAATTSVEGGRVADAPTAGPSKLEALKVVNVLEKKIPIYEEIRACMNGK